MLTPRSYPFIFPLFQFCSGCPASIMLIPHIDFVIPNESNAVEFKVFLFSVLPKVILDLKKVLLVSILIPQCFKTQVRVFSNKRRMMQEM